MTVVANAVAASLCHDAAARIHSSLSSVSSEMQTMQLNNHRFLRIARNICVHIYKYIYIYIYIQYMYIYIYIYIYMIVYVIS